VFWHDHVAVDIQPVVSPNALQGGFEGLLCVFRVEKLKPSITAERHEMRLLGLMEPLEGPGHELSLVAGTPPLKQKKLEWATRVRVGVGAVRRDCRKSKGWSAEEGQR
jgi:hypothetical protein